MLLMSTTEDQFSIIEVRIDEKTGSGGMDNFYSHSSAVMDGVSIVHSISYKSVYILLKFVQKEKEEILAYIELLSMKSLQVFYFVNY